MSRRAAAIQSSTVQTADGTGTIYDMNGREEPSAAVFLLDVTASSGVLPTLNVYIQTEIPDYTFGDIAAFAQVTGITRRLTIVVPSGPGVLDEFAVTDTTLTAGTVRYIPLGTRYRVRWKIGGVGASFTFSVSASMHGV